MHTAGSEHRQLQPVWGCVVTTCPLLGRSRTSLPKPTSCLKRVVPFFSRLQLDPNNSSFPFIFPNPSTFPSLISIKSMPSLCVSLSEAYYYLCVWYQVYLTKLHPIPRLSIQRNRLQYAIFVIWLFLVPILSSHSPHWSFDPQSSPSHNLFVSPFMVPYLKKVFFSHVICLLIYMCGCVHTHVRGEVQRQHVGVASLLLPC